MGLQSVFQQAAKTAVAAFGDVAASVVYASYSSTSYNTSSGVVTPTYSSTAAVTCILTGVTKKQLDNSAVRPSDRMALVPALNIPGVTPGVNDRIRQGTATWEVYDAEVDAAGAVWKLLLRQPKG